MLQLTEADSNSHSLQNSITECVLLRCVSLHVDSLGLISQMHNGYHQVSFFPHKLVVFFFLEGMVLLVSCCNLPLPFTGLSAPMVKLSEIYPNFHMHNSILLPAKMGEEKKNINCGLWVAIL